MLILYHEQEMIQIPSYGIGFRSLIPTVRTLRSTTTRLERGSVQVQDGFKDCTVGSVYYIWEN